MKSLWNAFRGLMVASRTDADVEVEEQTTSQLLRLLSEIILLVASLLPTPSAACLALCSRRLNYILGTGAWRSLQIEAANVLLGFLLLLAKDLPQYFVCRECTCLHPMNAIQWPRQIAYRLGPRCIRQSFSYYRPYMSRYRIYFSHIHLAMKQYHHDTDIGFPLEAFRHLEVIQDQRKTTLLSVDAQIVSNELLMRSQTWILLPWSQRDKIIDELAEVCLSNDVCIHTQLGPLKRSLVSYLVKSRPGQLEAQERCRPQALHCPYCWVDYTLDAVGFGERGFAVVITRWINLGTGLDSAGAKWQSHITSRLPRGVHHSHFPGDIRTGFERDAEVSVADLTSDNKHKLLSKRRTRLVYRGPDGIVWKWDSNDSCCWYLAPSGPPQRSFLEFFRGNP